VRACAQARRRVHARVYLLIQRMPHIVSSFVVSLVLPNFSTLSHKWYDFRKKTLFNTMYVFRFSTQLLFGIFLILRIIQRDIVINVKTLFLTDFNET
jgi:hypothetical protein